MRVPYDALMRRFSVDEVAQASDRLPTQPLRDRYPNALAIGGDLSTPLIDHGATHPLLAAVGLAFAQHRPLVISPDAVWLTIAQGVAQHVRLHAEQLRPRLVRHHRRKRLTVTTNGVPADADAWARAIDDYRALLAEEISDGRARLFECDFSTSTDVDRLASQIVLLDAYSPYFSLWMICICGIPSITLTGTTDDWRRIRERLDVVAELDLGFWCRSLAPILDQFVSATGGAIDLDFWRRIYNPFDAYGGELITGWITRLYPYVEYSGRVDTPNPMLDLPIDEPKQRTTATQRNYAGPGLRSDSVPAVLSRVTVHIVDRAAGEQRSVDIVAGVTAVTQDDDGALRPIAGWYLESATVKMDKVLERIVAEHKFVRAPSVTNHRYLQGPAEVIELFSQLDSATMFDGANTWRLRSPREHHQVGVERSGQFSIQRIADIPAGRSLCAATRHSTGQVYWLVCRIEEPQQSEPGEIEVMAGAAKALDLPDEIRILAGSLASILDAALVSNGDIDHLEVGRFYDLLKI
jgi:hypothetical protein